jgi:hypothetical protein
MASEISAVGCVVVTLWTLVESTARLGCRLAQLQQMMGFKPQAKVESFLKIFISIFLEFAFSKNKCLSQNFIKELNTRVTHELVKECHLGPQTMKTHF